MQVSDIQTRVKRQFGDESGVQVTDEDIIRWINDGMRQIVLQNETLFEKTSLTSSVASQEDYTLPADLLILRGISYRGPGDTAYFRLNGYSLNEFNEYIDGWDGSAHMQGVPVGYTIFEQKIKLFPIPADNTTDAIKIYYNRMPTEVSGPTDIPEIPTLYHETLVKYCLSQAYEIDENFEAMSAKGQQVAADVNMLRGREDWKVEEYYPNITVLSDDYY